MNVGWLFPSKFVYDQAVVSVFLQQFEFVTQAVVQLPWSYQRLLISKVKDINIAITYADVTHKNGCSRDTLEANINSNYHAQERAIEQALTQRITDFMLELGKGFAFVGRQYQLEIGEADYFLDLLFYHLHLRCYVVIELKAGKFKPKYAGKLNFYLSAVDN